MGFVNEVATSGLRKNMKATQRICKDGGEAILTSVV